jgi:CHAT domain-containing protein/Tfp pilus assembly protein PilF
LGNIAVAHHQQGDRLNALRLYKEALAVHREVGDRVGEGRALSNIGALSQELGRIEDALRYGSEALVIRRELGDRAGEAVTVANLGLAHHQLGRLQEALGCFEEALRIDRELGNRIGESTTLDSLGGVLCGLGRYQEALVCYEDALDIQRQIGYRLAQGATLNNVGGLYSKLGHHEEAVRHFQEALAITRDVRDRPGEATTLFNVAKEWSRLGRVDEAVRLYEEALSIQREVGDRLNEAQTLAAIAELRLKPGQHEEALHRYKQVLAICEELGDQGRRAEILTHIGWWHFTLGQHDEAIRWYEEALALARKLGHRAGEAIALGTIGASYHITGRLPMAEKFYEEALELYETIRGELLSEELRAHYLAEVLNTYRLYIALLVERCHREADVALASRAFDLAERSTARSMAELLAEARLDIRKDADVNLLAEEQETIDRMRAAHHNVQKLRSAPEHDPQAIARAESQLNDLEEAHRRLQDRIKQSSPRYARHVRPEPIHLEDVQGRLREEGDTALLRYVLAPHQSFLWVITFLSVEVLTLPGEQEIEEKVRQLRDAVTAGESHYPWGYELHRDLLGQAKTIHEGQRLLIVPDGILHYLPFSLLLTEPPGPSPFEWGVLPYLMRQHAIVQSPSATVWATVRQEREARAAVTYENQLVAFAPFALGDNGGDAPKGVIFQTALEHTGIQLIPLIFSGPEVEELADLYGRYNSLLRLGKDATKAAATAPEVLGCRYVHFSTHGLLDEEKPQLSGLAMAPDQNDDGFWRVFEMFNAELNAELAVLNGCDTGRGKLLRGEGVVGLTRALLYAGASAVCISIWPVLNMWSALLWARFYDYLRRPPIDKAEALRRAQLDLVARGDEAGHPRNWAAFVLIGDRR